MKFKEKDYNLIFYHFGEIQAIEEEIVNDEDEEKMSYLPTSAREILLSDFDLRKKDGIFSQVDCLNY